MANPFRLLALAPLVVVTACSTESTGADSAAGGFGGVTTAGQAAAVDTSGAGSVSAGSNGSAGSGAGSGSGALGGGGGLSGAGGALGTPGTAGQGGGGAAAGSGGSGPVASGHSLGCGKVPDAGDTEGKFVLKELHVSGITNPLYLSGGKLYQDKQLPRAGKYDYQFRPYSVRLPKGYDPNKPYAVVLGGGGCGSNAENFAANPGGGYQPDTGQSTIQVGLSYLNTCFDDGGRFFADNQLKDTPEIPYVRQVIEAVQGAYCVDKSLVFESGSSSGGWETYTTGCAAADVIRAIGPVAGGLRQTRPACAGKQAAIMVVGLQDGANPIGPEAPANTDRDSPGSAVARDEILKRNGCVAPDYVFDYSDTSKKLGSAPHEPWDSNYPSCVKYTGCPAEYPVVWCALDCGHQCDNETIDGKKVDYKQGIWKFWSSLPPR